MRRWPNGNNWQDEEFRKKYGKPPLQKDDITFVIGPEGGFDPNEYISICDLGFKSISLGKRILRTETASLVITSNILYELEEA